MYISDIENGKRIPIKGKAIKAYAKYFNVEYRDLINVAVTDRLERE